MRPTVAKYACDRIDRMAAKKIKELEEQNKILPHSSSEVYEMLKEGTLKLKKKAPKNNRYGNCFTNCLDDYFDVEQITTVNTFADYHEEEVENVKNEVTKIKDEIWLGNEVTAKKYLQDFEDF